MIDTNIYRCDRGNTNLIQSSSSLGNAQLPLVKSTRRNEQGSEADKSSSVILEMEMECRLRGRSAQEGIGNN
jgi:hypothetical protein